MPLLSITTNRPLKSEAAGSILRAASDRVAKLLGKPESYVMVKLAHNPHMLFAGNDAPLTYIELKSIGLPVTQTPVLSTALTELLHEHQGIEPARIYIEFSDALPQMWGWNGATF